MLHLNLDSSSLRSLGVEIEAQGDNSKDRYKLTVFLKVILREEFSENTLFMHYPENLHRIFGGIPNFLDCAEFDSRYPIRQLAEHARE